MKKAKVYKPDRVGGVKKFDSNSDRQALYKSQEWVKYRFRYLATNKQCYSCPNPAKVVDHIIAHKGNLALFEQNDNHLPLCSSCHSTVTQLFDKHEKPKTEEKVKWLTSMREKHKIDFRVKVIPYRK